MPNFGILFRQPDRIEPVHYDTPDQRQAKALSLQHMQQQAAASDVALQNAQMQQQQQWDAMQDERAFRDDYTASGGDMEKLKTLIAQRKGDPRRYLELQAKLLEHREKLAKLGKEEFETAHAKAQAESAVAQRLMLAKPEERAAMWPAARAELARLGHAMPEAYPGDNAIAFLHAAGSAEKDLHEQVMNERKDARAGEEHTATLPGKQATSRRDQMVAAGQAIGAVNDQAGYDALLKDPTLGKFISDYYQSPMFSPELKKRIEQGGQSANERISAQLTADRDKTTADHYNRSDAETARHNRMLEAFNQAVENRHAKNEKQMDELAKVVGQHPELYSRLTPSAQGALAPALAAAGFQQFGKMLNDSAVSHLSELTSATNMANQLKGRLEKTAHLTGPISGLAAANPYNEDARNLQAEIDLVRQKIGKALEGGVLRKEDEEKYQKILPTMTDTPNSARHKINQLITMLGQDTKTFEDTQRRFGRNVPGASPAVQLPAGGGKVIDKATAQRFYEAAGGDPTKAQQLAEQNGWKVQ